MVNKYLEREPLNLTDKVNSSKNYKSKILLVEDVPLIQFIHKKMLTSLNCQVTVVSSAEDALAITNEKYDLIFLDIGLPGMNGIQATKKFRCQKKYNQTRIIILTSLNDENIQRTCLSIGIEQVLIKPVDIKKFKEVIYENNIVGNGDLVQEVLI